MTERRNSGEPVSTVEGSGSGQVEHGMENTDTGPSNSDCYPEVFSKVWRASTSDNHLTLFGFRRFRTTHLLNIRFLEAEIDEVDHKLYQAGLHLDQPTDRGHVLDRLGLKHSKKDSKAVKIEDVVHRDLVIRLRQLIKEYGSYIFEALRFD
ncbi:MAG: hypothetical protein M1822_006872 [Bathelium mastoideum]|nr:MAG: hypothetical protein M1822_006872 [Bathelium mastoideum]